MLRAALEGLTKQLAVFEKYEIAYKRAIDWNRVTGVIGIAGISTVFAVVFPPAAAIAGPLSGAFVKGAEEIYKMKLEEERKKIRDAKSLLTQKKEELAGIEKGRTGLPNEWVQRIKSLVH